jgi:hypothetical protein
MELQLRSGRLALLVVPGDPVVYRFDSTREESRLARLEADEVLSRYGLTMAPALWPVAGCDATTGDSVAVPDGGAVTVHAGASPVEVPM